MKKLYSIFCLAFLLNAFIVKSQQFSPENVVVLRIGDGANPLDINATSVFLDEYTPGGQFVRTIAMPTSVNGTNGRFTLNPENLIFGALTLSPDGKYLAASGFDAPVGAPRNDVVDGPAYDRTVAIIDYNGNVNTSTKLPTSDVGINYSYSAVTSNGTDIWATYSNSGIRYMTIGSSSTTLINSTTTFRYLGIVDGQMYGTTANGRIWKVGSGVPTTGGQTITQLPGVSGGVSGASQFYFADLNPAIPGADVLYVAAVDALALKKYCFDGTSWKLNGTIGVNADDYTSITGTVNPGGTGVTLFIVRKTGNIPSGGAELIKLTDNTGYTLVANSFTGTPDWVISAPNQTSFRGVSMAPINCKKPTITLSNLSPIGVDVSWSNGGSAASFEYTISTNPTPPASGTFTTSLNYNTTGLTPGLQYYVHVRSNCGGTEFSQWATSAFTTTWPPCVLPSIFPIVNNANGTVTITWNPVLSAIKYEYAISLNATPPASGNFITANSYIASGLHSAKQYYFHIRAYCGSGDTSVWATKPFFTGCYKPIPFLIGNNITTGTADVGWNGETDIKGYEYAILNNPVPPGGTKSFTTDTVLHLTDLSPGSNYYLHVRRICSGSSFSEWSTLAFRVSGVGVYPNPSHDKITIQLTGHSSGSQPVKIYDDKGRLMKSLLLVGNTATVDIRTWAAGIYYVQYGSGKSYVTKIMKW